MGIDNIRVETRASCELTPGEMMAGFLTFKRCKVGRGELSLSTLDGYLKEVQAFVGTCGVIFVPCGTTVVSGGIGLGSCGTGSKL